ncbi:MAG: DUF2800 domain-containing protein [Micropruina sp.]|nr:DUF2800 domain-containing protein [Micropruina sp.]
MTEKKHLTFGGSSAHRWLNCPGSARLCSTLPPQVENEHMAAGTRAHALLELAVREGRDSVMDFAGVALQPGWPEFGADDVEAVQIAVDYVNKLLSKYPDAVLWVERMFTLPAGASDDVGGTADVVVYAPSMNLLTVIDYKHGRGKYVNENTPQMKLYAACVMFGITEYLIERVDATIIQPRCQVGEPIRTAIYSPSDLIAFSDDVDAAVAAAKTEDPPLIPGDEQCHWCPAAHVCPALASALPATAASVAEWGGELDAGATVVSLPPPSAMRADPAKLAETLKALPVIQAWIDAVEAHAEELAMGGVLLPGFKLIPKQARRKWVDETHAFRWFLKETLLDEDEFAPRNLLSVARAEKVVKKAAGSDGVKAMAALVVKESSGLKLVPDSAKGDAINPLAVAEAGFVSAVTI